MSETLSMFDKPYIVNGHTLIHAKDGGGGYHGYCKHCGLALVTDLGFCSWDNTTCIDREEFFDESDIPSIIISFAYFKGLRWHKLKQKYVKSYENIEYSVSDLATIIQSIKR